MLDNTTPSLAASWIAVATAEELGDAPLAVRVLGEPWVIARLGDDGAPVAFADRCPHRLAPLSAGTVVDGELQCGYHGWRFDAAGDVTAVPALGARATLPPRGCLRPAADVAEHLGLVWIAVEPPLAPLPELVGWDRLGRPDSRWLSARCEVVRTPVSAVQLIDNFMDAAHFPFVHPDSFGVEDAFDVSNDAITRDGWVVRSTFTAPYQNHDDPLVATGEHPLVQEHTVTKVGHAGCNASLELRFPLTRGVFGIVYACQPETATSTRIFKVMCRNDIDEAGMADCVVAEDEILREDLRILERYTDMTLELDLTVEVHTRADRLSVAWRRLMSDLHLHRRSAASWAS